ncbi:MAG TPA: TIGR02453 family protein, partial [Polyangia bacterium]|nr:TIGR02453 family protein [Polyangia bacterium]
MGTTYFTPDLFRFLRELAANNNREWFNDNKQRYEQSVRDPFLRFVGDLAPRLKKISPRFVADPKPVGGSMMRIYRDTRFAKDKSPYKTAVMAHFWHDKGKEGATPAFFMRVQPGDSSVGGGI